MSITRRTVLLASALPITKWAVAEETIKLGRIDSVTGANAEQGRFRMNGARLALDIVNSEGGVLGKQLELLTEDDQTTNPGEVRINLVINVHVRWIAGVPP